VCWDVFGETTPFGAEERQMLHAERWLCDEQGTSHGAIVVHVMLDYEALPFLSSKSPYFEFVRATDDRGALEALRADVTLAIYGWGRTPVFTSAGQAWPLSDTLFARIYASRDPFWTTVDTPAGTQKVYIANDRAGIYAVGYPLPSWFDHAVRVAELLTLATVFFLIGALAHALAAWVAWPTAPPGVRLLREFRTSFSRKLFVAFVLATAVPVLVLAVAIRAYVAGQLRGDIEAEATRTAQVARRVIEETLARSATRDLGHGPHRRCHGVDQPHHRSGRQHLRGHRARGDQRARPLCVGRAADARAGASIVAWCSTACRALSPRTASASA
jgi:hypothetical protein